MQQHLNSSLYPSRSPPYLKNVLQQVSAPLLNPSCKTPCLSFCNSIAKLAARPSRESAQRCRMQYCFIIKKQATNETRSCFWTLTARPNFCPFRLNVTATRKRSECVTDEQPVIMNIVNILTRVSYEYICFKPKFKVCGVYFLSSEKPIIDFIKHNPENSKHVYLSQKNTKIKSNPMLYPGDFRAFLQNNPGSITQCRLSYYRCVQKSIYLGRHIDNKQCLERVHFLVSAVTFTICIGLYSNKIQINEICTSISPISWTPRHTIPPRVLFPQPRYTVLRQRREIKIRNRLWTSTPSAEQELPERMLLIRERLWCSDSSLQWHTLRSFNDSYPSSESNFNIVSF